MAKTTFLLVLSLRCGLDSLPPPTLLAPGKQDTFLWQTPVNPFLYREPYTPYTPIVKPLPKNRPKKHSLRLLLATGLSFVAGASWGLHETLQHHWPAFKRKHPGANEQWWNPSESWRNKYRSRDPDQGRTGIPVQFTDAKHLLVLGHNATLFGAGVCIGIGKPRKWWRCALDAGASLVAYSAGNYLTYNILYRPP